MPILYSILATIALIFALAWFWRQLVNAPVAPDKVWVCSWCSGWFGKDGISYPDAPAVVSDPVSHGICKHCREVHFPQPTSKRVESNRDENPALIINAKPVPSCGNGALVGE